MNQFFNNLFGSIAGDSGILQRLEPGIDFIPINGQGGTIDIKGQDASWLGLQNRLMQKWAYEYCFPLASVVDRLAEADTTGVIEILRYKGKGKEDFATSAWAQRMNKLLAQPNPLQSWEQFRGQQIVYKKIFGFCPVLPIMPSSISDRSYAVAIINLPPWTFDAVSTNKMLGQSEIEGLVQEYTCNLLGEKKHFTPDQLFILNDGFMQDENCNWLLPKSKLVGLDMAVSNICAAMEADNVLLKKRGPLGFISHDAAATKDSVSGYLPMTTKEKTEIQDSLQQYGLSWNQFQYAISRQAIKWNPMSYNVTELGTKDTVISGEKAICHRYGYSYILYEDSGATYANQSGAHKALYQNNVIPNNTKDLGKYNEWFESVENNCTIVADFSDLPILQENEKEKADAAKAWNDALKIEYESGLITKNQWLTARGYETIAGGDEYFKLSVPDGGTTGDEFATPVDVEAEAKANLKGSVGGVQGLLAIQLSVSQGVTDYEAAVATLFEIYGFDDATARKLLGDKEKLEAQAKEPKQPSTFQR